MATQEERDSLITELCALTGDTNRELAASLLASNDWTLDTAASLWFESQEQGLDEDDAPQEPTFTSPPPQAPATASSSSGGGRTLGGGPAPAASSSSSASQPVSYKPTSKGPRTLKDLQANSSSHGHGHGDDDSDDENPQQDFFAGGEKSGLAVQNPDAGNNLPAGRNHQARDVVNSILDQARRGAPRPGGDDPVQQRTHFRGGGHKLGGDEAPSEYVPAARRTPSPPPRVNRVLHMWDDGFSVDDGDLYRFDDPANTDTLRMIQSGRAPLSLLNVEPGQEVDLEVHPHRGEKYQAPKKKYKPFGGQGQRLGSPTPGVGSSSTSTFAPPSAASSSAAASSSTAASTPTVNVNESEPTLSLQIRLGDGTRLSSRFNTTHTIGDVYGFVNAASTASSQRPYVLMTTFPSQELNDKAKVLGDMSEFKRGGVVVQKWT